jgi:N-acetylglutamate synthase-like GNAT family acetyltransferase
MTPADVPFSVRSVTSDDLPKIAKFIEPFVAEGKLLPRTSEELEDLLPHGFIAEAAGEIVGFAALEIYSPKMSEVRSLAVSPHLRGRGVGRQLVDHCVARARERQVLEVMAITSNEEFFKQCGFDFTLPGEKKALFLLTRDL